LDPTVVHRHATAQTCAKLEIYLTTSQMDTLNFMLSSLHDQEAS
jgi:hypothetical protein